MNESPTPRTDAASNSADRLGDRDAVPSAFARGLEREITELRAVIAAIYNHNEAARAAVVEHYGISHLRPHSANPYDAITDSRNADEPEDVRQKIREPKHSAIASLLWQYADELETKAHWWRETKDDPHQISVVCYVSLNEQAAALRKVLERSYGKRTKS